jgi:hypothetical protein
VKDVNENTPDRSNAAAFPRYLSGEVVTDCVALQWSRLMRGAGGFRAWSIVSLQVHPSSSTQGIGASFLSSSNQFTTT